MSLKVMSRVSSTVLDGQELAALAVVHAKDDAVAQLEFAHAAGRGERQDRACRVVRLLDELEHRLGFFRVVDQGVVRVPDWMLRLRSSADAGRKCGRQVERLERQVGGAAQLEPAAREQQREQRARGRRVLRCASDDDVDQTAGHDDGFADGLALNVLLYRSLGTPSLIRMVFWSAPSVAFSVAARLAVDLDHVVDFVLLQSRGIRLGPLRRHDVLAEAPATLEFATERVADMGCDGREQPQQNRKASSDDGFVIAAFDALQSAFNIFMAADATVLNWCFCKS